MSWPPRPFTAPAPRSSAPTLAALAESLKPQTEGEPEATALFIPDDAAAVAAIAGGLAGSPLKGVQLLGTNLLNNATSPCGPADCLARGDLP